MRKVSAVLTALFVMAATVVVFALPAGAGEAYPPESTAPAAEPASTKLAFTGSDSKPLVIVAILAIALGAVLVVATRRRATVRATKG